MIALNGFSSFCQFASLTHRSRTKWTKKWAWECRWRRRRRRNYCRIFYSSILQHFSGTEHFVSRYDTEATILNKRVRRRSWSIVISLDMIIFIASSTSSVIERTSGSSLIDPLANSIRYKSFFFPLCIDQRRRDHQRLLLSPIIDLVPARKARHHRQSID